MAANEQDWLVRGMFAVMIINLGVTFGSWYTTNQRLDKINAAPDGIAGGEPGRENYNWNTNTNILGEDEARRKKLESEPELKTSDLGDVMGVTSDAILKRIETDADGSKWFSHAGRRYAVRRHQNTYMIENPFAESRQPFAE